MDKAIGVALLLILMFFVCCKENSVKLLRKRWLLCSAAVFGIIVGALLVIYVAFFNTAACNFGVVEEGKVYRSGQPDEKFFQELAEKYKIRTIVNLQRSMKKYERDFADRHGIRLIRIKMSARLDPADSDIEKFLDVVGDPANHPVLVHCYSGSDRTGLMIALKRFMLDGWSISDAEREMIYYRHFSFITPMPTRRLRRYVREQASSEKNCGCGSRNVAGQFLAAADKEIITPNGQVSLSGFSPKRISLGVHDDLYARCLVIECPSGQKLAVVSLDLIGFMRYDVLKIKERLRRRKVMDTDWLIICSTHQHAGPDTIGIWGRSALPIAPHLSGSGRDESYMETVREKIAILVERTAKKLSEGELVYIEASGKGYSRNIRIESEIDESLNILVAAGPGEIIGALVNFGVHPEAYNRSNQLITADFPGVLVNQIESKWGGTALFVNGLLGAMVSVNRQTIPGQYPSGEKRAEAAGFGLAERIFEAESKAKRISGSCLRLQRKLVAIPLDNFYFQEGMKLGIIPYSPETLTNEQKVLTEVGIVSLGDLKILLVPGEMQPGLGLKIKALIGAKMVFGLANDEIGYILPTEDFYSDLYKYERTMSVGPETGRLIYEAFRQMATR